MAEPARAAGPERTELLYVTAYLNDPAVRRRVRMLRLGGVHEMRVTGFRRTPEPVEAIEGLPVVDLGQTADGRLARRVGTVLAALLRTGAWSRTLGQPSIILARSLEALLLAEAVRRRHAPTAVLVYESLDIHRALLGTGLVPTALRRLEAHLLGRCSLVLTSSPGFVTHYFDRFHCGSAEIAPEIAVVENKMLAPELPPGTLPLVARTGSAGLEPGPPWRIGWYGLLRCTRSLQVLARLCRRFPGRVEVHLRGRPAASMSADFAAVVAATPGMAFGGPYDRARDLAGLYSDVHFSWTVDFSESGANSDWLLPNRLYEAGPFGCVPIAMRSVEAGRWLARRGMGVLLDEPVEASLKAWFAQLDGVKYSMVRQAILDRPVSDFVDDRDDAEALVARLRSLSGVQRPVG